MKHKFKILVFCIFCLVSSQGNCLAGVPLKPDFSQSTDNGTGTTATASSNNPNLSSENMAPAGPQTEGGQPWSPTLVTVLCLSLLLFGVIVSGTMAAFLYLRVDAGDILRLFSLPLIIVSAVFLVVAGYSDKQIAPVVGLLGSIAGYLLGSHQRKSDGDSRPDDGRPRPGP